uniref:Uncharacterized protein n=1 Tax=Romanomermis culicivorax TaxID=13658 RepID=A0A915J4C5_ROMCU
MDILERTSIRHHTDGRVRPATTMAATTKCLHGGGGGKDKEWRKWGRVAVEHWERLTAWS